MRDPKIPVFRSGFPGKRVSNRDQRNPTPPLLFLGDNKDRDDRLGAPVQKEQRNETLSDAGRVTTGEKPFLRNTNQKQFFIFFSLEKVSRMQNAFLHGQQQQE